jgi:hypothetical protein
LDRCWQIGHGQTTFGFFMENNKLWNLQLQIFLKKHFSTQRQWLYRQFMANNVEKPNHTTCITHLTTKYTPKFDTMKMIDTFNIHPYKISVCQSYKYK